jgi:Ras-related GTP-binding protein C/D
MRSVLSEFGVGGHAQTQEVQISYHLTSIYDHTIYQALSRVIQKLLPQVQYVTQLLDQLVRSSQI